MQYFLGYQGFLADEPFDASLMVDFRKKLGFDKINEINDLIVKLKTKWAEKPDTKQKNDLSEKKEKEGENTDFVGESANSCIIFVAIFRTFTSCWKNMKD